MPKDDMERCEWLNKIVKKVWPNANHIARKFVKNNIEPKISEAFTDACGYSFKFDRIILGRKTPRIVGINIIDGRYNNNSIIMNLDLFYTSDCDINFKFFETTAGIKEFYIRGMVRVIMTPLLSSMPLVGGLQICFVNNPNVDYNLNAVIVIGILELPLLKYLLRDLILKQIAANMVSPKKLKITLNNAEESHSQ